MLHLNRYFGTLFHRAFVYDCLHPLACEILKDQDHALFLYPQPPVQVGEKTLRGEVGKKSEEHLLCVKHCIRGAMPPKGQSMSYLKSEP